MKKKKKLVEKNIITFFLILITKLHMNSEFLSMWGYLIAVLEKFSALKSSSSVVQCTFVIGWFV